MIAIIAAIAKNRCIGINGQLPWHLPEDFAHFKRHTIGKVVLMGRKTWESLPSKFRPLPNRTNVVLTRQKKTSGFFSPDAEVYDSLETALAAHASDDVYIIGGAQLYGQTIDRANRLIITHVDRTMEGDAYFPEIRADQWIESHREERVGFAFVTYERTRVIAG